VLEGGGGADTIDGDAGVDTASFAGSEAGLNVNLATGVASGGDAAGDVLSNIENLTGSDFADNLTGDSAANQISGGGGNDVMSGGDGNNTIDGGADSAWTDTIDLDNPGDFGTDWTIDLDPGSTIENQTANSLDLSDDASGTINLSDGSEISFENIERFDW